jgi:hypothetical protein
MLSNPVAVDATIGQRTMELVTVPKDQVLLIDDLRMSYEGLYPAEIGLIDTDQDDEILTARARADGTITRDRPRMTCRGSLSAIVRGTGTAHVSLRGRLVHIAQAPKEECRAPDIDYLCHRKIVHVRNL